MCNLYFLALAFFVCVLLLPFPKELNLQLRPQIQSIKGFFHFTRFLALYSSDISVKSFKFFTILHSSPTSWILFIRLRPGNTWNSKYYLLYDNVLVLSLFLSIRRKMSVHKKIFSDASYYQYFFSDLGQLDIF